MADLSQIEQIVMNLTVNSRDAMPNGGSLIVMTKNVELTGDDVKDIDGVSFGQYVLLSVEDTGIGMDEGMREKMFEPFFTSKVKEVSSGLGLSTVLGIVKQHNGFIRVVSAPDKGTEFKIYLPVTARQVEKPDIETRGERRGGDETILIAEDNYSIRKLFADIVKPLGYDVLEAGNAKEAMEVMKKHKKKIDLLLADVVMPGENGWVLYKKMKKQIPDLKVVFTSGYVENPIVLNKIEKKNMPFIKKPLSPHDLGNIIRRVLDE